MSGDYLAALLRRERENSLMTAWIQVALGVQPIGIIATLKIPDMDTAKYFFNKMIDPEGKIVFKNLTQMLSVLDVIRQFLYNQGKTMKDLMPGHTDDEVEKMIVDLGKRLFPKFFETQNVPLRTSELGIF